MELSNVEKILQSFPVNYDWTYENGEIGNTAMCCMTCNISPSCHTHNSIMVKFIINLQDGSKCIVHKFELCTNTLEQLETLLNEWVVVADNIKTMCTCGYQIWSTDQLHHVKIIGMCDVYDVIDLTVPL